MNLPATILPLWWGVTMTFLMALNGSNLKAQGGGGNHTADQSLSSNSPFLQFPNASVSAGANYNPLLSVWAANSEWNYWVQADAGLEVGNMPLRLQAEHHSNQTHSDLSDRFSVAVDVQELRRRLARQVRDRITNDIANPTAVNKWTNLNNRQKQIEAASKSEHLRQLVKRDSLRQTFQEKFGGRETDLTGLKDSIDLLEAQQINQPLTDSARQKLEHWKERYEKSKELLKAIESIDIDAQWEIYKSTLDQEVQNLQNEKQKLVNQYHLDEAALSKLEALSSGPENLLDQFGGQYLTKGQRFMSGIESLGAGRFGWNGNELFLNGVTVSGGEAVYDWNNQQFGGIIGTAHLLNIQSLYKGQAEVQPYHLIGFQLGRSGEQDEVSLQYYTLRQKFQSSPGEESNSVSFIGLSGQSEVPLTGTQVSYVLGSVRPLSEDQWLDDPGLDLSQVAANLTVEQPIWKKQIQLKAALGHVGSAYHVPGNPLIIPGAQSLKGTVEFQPTGKTYRVGLFGKEEHRVPLFGNQTTVIQQGGLQGTWQFARPFLLNVQVAPYTKTTPTSTSSALQSLISLTCNWKLGTLNSATQATFNRQGLEVFSGPDSIYTYTADQYTFRQQLELTSHTSLEATGSIYALDQALAKKLEGALVIGFTKPAVDLRASSNYYWDHPFFEGMAYRLAGSVRLGKFSLQVEGTKHNEVITWIHTPFTFSATAKYTIP